jgi:hypothetical protein
MFLYDLSPHEVVSKKKDVFLGRPCKELSPKEKRV